MLDLKEERRYTRLRKLAQELHIPMPEAFITLEVFDKDGRLIQRHHQRSHSWTRNAYNIMFCQLAGKDADDTTFEAGKLSGKDTGGSIRYGDFPIAMGRVKSTNKWCSVDGIANTTIAGYRAAGAEDAIGIVVGSGTNVESLENFELQTKIVNGTGAGELSYTESEEHSISYADTTLTNTLIRYFNNNTVGETSVDVNEVGLIGSVCCIDGSSQRLLLVTRDKLASTVTIPSTGQLKVTYTVELAYPA